MRLWFNRSRPSGCCPVCVYVGLVTASFVFFNIYTDMLTRRHVQPHSCQSSPAPDVEYEPEKPFVHSHWVNSDPCEEECWVLSCGLGCTKELLKLKFHGQYFPCSLMQSTSVLVEIFYSALFHFINKWKCMIIDHTLIV